jgi:hypothetical protein
VYIFASFFPFSIQVFRKINSLEVGSEQLIFLYDSRLTTRQCVLGLQGIYNAEYYQAVPYLARIQLSSRR